MAFTGFNNRTGYEIDKSIGELVFTAYEWGNDFDGNFFVTRERIPSHVCSREELGLDGDSSYFFPTTKNYIKQLETY